MGLRSLALCLLLATSPALPARGVTVLDQVVEPAFPSGFFQFNERSLAQSFTVGRSGDLARVEVFISQLDPEGDLLVSIVSTEAGVPVFPTPDTWLAREIVPLDEVPSSSPGGTGPDWVGVDLAEIVPVTEGDVLAVALARDRGGTSGRFGVGWKDGPEDSYPGGQSFAQPINLEERFAPFSSPTDLAFRTFVAVVPEPTSALVFAVGAALVMWRGGRRAPGGG